MRSKTRHPALRWTDKPAFRQDPGPISPSGGVDEPGSMENGSLEITRPPLTDISIGPGGVLIRVADIAGIGRFIGHRDGGCRGPHRVIGTPHPGEFGFGHMAGNAPAGFIIGRVVRVSGRVRHVVGVTGHAGAVRLVFLKKVASAGCVAMQAVEPAGLDTGACQPQGEGVILSEVASVRIEIRVFKRGKRKMIEVSVSGPECRGEGGHFRMTGRAQIVHLLVCECFQADDLRIFGDMVPRGPPGTREHVRRRRRDRFRN